jgi:hypothetical protein
MNAVDKYFFSGDNFTTIKSLTAGKVVPMLPDNIAANMNLYEVYNSAVLLSNFDNAIFEYFSNVIDVDFNLFNNLQNDDKGNKYKINIEGLKTEYFKNDVHDAESSESAEVKLVKMLVSTIPFYNKKGEYYGQYMKMDHFYLFAAKISDFEITYGNELKREEGSKFKYFNENPREGLLWYINNIMDAINNPGSNKKLADFFKDSYEFAYSLKKYLESDEMNILGKEENTSNLSLLSIFGQIVNNNFGANYYSYSTKGTITIRDAYKQNFNRLNLQGSLFNFFRRVANKDLFDPKKSSEILDSIISNDNDIKNLSISQKKSLSKFIKSRTGIMLSYIGIQDFIEDWMSNNEALTETSQFKTSLISFVNTLGKDQLKVADIEEDVAETVRGDIEVSIYVSDTINDSIYKGIEAAYVMNYPIQPIMALETMDRNKIPTFKLANLTYKDTELFEQQRELEKKE